MTTPKRRGRPPLDPHDRSVDVHVRLSTTQYDTALAHARAARMDLADWIRRALPIANTNPPTMP